VPPPIEANGSGVEHPVLLVGAGAGVVVVVVVGVVDGAGEVVVVVGVLQAIPGGSQPPLQQVPPPSDANGLGVVHAMLLVGAGAVVDVVVGGVDVVVDGGGVDVVVIVVGIKHVIPGGSQPPLQQVPPPIETNGLGVEQPALLVGAGTGAVVVVVVVVLVDGGGVDVVVVVGMLHVIPGGNQPPLQQIPPPIEANGSGVEQDALFVGAGAVVVDVLLVVGVLQARPGGSQPPLQQVPPPMDTNGSEVVHEAVPIIVATTSFERWLLSPSGVYASTAK
jgi:hypothetical protein